MEISTYKLVNKCGIGVKVVMVRGIGNPYKWLEIKGVLSSLGSSQGIPLQLIVMLN